MPDGNVLVGGNFTSAGGVAARAIAKYNVHTNTFSPVGPLFNHDANVSAIVALPNGDIIAGGEFLTQFQRVARYYAATNTWVGIGGPIGGGGFNAMASLPNGDVLVVGGYGFSRYTPSTDSWSTITIANNHIMSLAVMPDGDVVIGGRFTEIEGVPVGRIARWHPPTNTWTAMGTEASGSGVAALLALPNGELIAGGSFVTPDGSQTRNIGRYSPVTNSWSPLNSHDGYNGGVSANTVLSLARLPDGQILVGGNFDSAINPVIGGSVPDTSGFARFNLETKTWSSLGAGFQGWVSAILPLTTGDVLLGGVILNTPAGTVRHLARWNLGSTPPAITIQPVAETTAVGGSVRLSVIAGGTTPLTYQWRRGGVPITDNPSATTAVLVLESLPPGNAASYDCVVTTLCGTSTVSTASSVIVPSPVCPADLGVQGGFHGHDGILDNNDFIAFIDLFFQGC